MSSPAVQFETVRYEVEGPVATVTLDRAPYNAMTQLMVFEVHQLLTQLAADDQLRVVVLTGNGRTFCPGADLDHVASGVLDADLSAMHYRVPLLLHEMPQVTIAAINGACAGAGIGWAAACDLRLATRRAKFRTAFLDVGVAGDMGGTWTMSRSMGGAVARDWYLLPDKHDADEAQRCGLVSRVYDDDVFAESVQAVVDRLAAAVPEALLTMKANLVAAERMTFADYVDLETERHMRAMEQPEARGRFKPA